MADLVYTGDGLLFTAACNASFTNLFLSPGFLLSAAAVGTISKSKTCKPIPAKWQAILDPITPLPNTATFLIERFI